MNQKHYDKILEGVKAWNNFVEEERQKDPKFKADLSKADFRGDHIKRTALYDPNVAGANLMEANLAGANLLEANLKRANLAGAKLEEANLWEANLKRANLWEANLAGAKLMGANLEGASLLGANLLGANLMEADLWEANLKRANLERASLLGANLERASLEGANVEGANLAGANLRNATVTNVEYKKLGACRGIRLEGCHGSPRFIRDAKDNEYVEEFRSNHPFLWALWSVSSDCGRSILRWALWSLLFALYFGIIFYLMGEENFHLKDEIINKDPWTYLYYSIVTFTTLGFGDVTPTTIQGMLYVSLEVILGYMMLGGLISIMATKIARRA